MPRDYSVKSLNEICLLKDDCVLFENCNVSVSRKPRGFLSLRCGGMLYIACIGYIDVLVKSGGR